MKVRSGFALALVVAVGAITGCEDDETGPEEERFVATLTGAAERPNPVTTAASGEATFTVNGDEVEFEITGEDLVGVRLAHIHGPATTEVAAGVIVTLLTPVAAPGFNVANGTVSEGAFPSTAYTLATGITMDSVLVLMRNGNAYVNVHTVANGGGEIRGQIRRDN